MSRTVLLATEKAFSKTARDEVVAIIEKAGYTAKVLENYKGKGPLLEAIADADAAIVRSDIVDPEVLDAAKKLKLVVRAGAGYDNIDTAAAKAKGIAVMNTPGQNANAVAELAFAMMIYAARGKFDGKTGTEIRGKTLGLHAFGMVGRAMATAARLRYGCTWINTHFMLVNEMPHGGLKRSGYGKDMSSYALEDYTAVRHVMIKH